MTPVRMVAFEYAPTAPCVPVMQFAYEYNLGGFNEWIAYVVRLFAAITQAQGTKITQSSFSQGIAGKPLTLLSTSLFTQRGCMLSIFVLLHLQYKVPVTCVAVSAKSSR